MKTFLYFLPNAALFFVLLRMAEMKLYRPDGRPGIFWFLAAWLVYSGANILARAAHATHTTEFARFYFWSSIIVLALVALPLSRPLARLLLDSPWLALLVPVAAFFAALLIHRLYLRGILARPGTAALALTCFLAVMAGAIFFLASFGVSRGFGTAFLLDLILWRGLGLYLLAFGYGLLAARLWGRNESANAWPLFACTLVWIGLFVALAPTPDALVARERLAFAPGCGVLGLGYRGVAWERKLSRVERFDRTCKASTESDLRVPTDESDATTLSPAPDIPPATVSRRRLHV